MQKSSVLWFTAAVVAASRVAAQSAAPLLRHTFDDSTSGWIAAGAGAKVSVSSQMSYNGRGALRFDYEVSKGKMSALLLQTPLRILESAKSIRFWANADHPTSIAVVLQEKTGARYIAPFSLPKRTWQPVELSSVDFAAMDGMGGPPDANGRLDMDQVIALTILDMGQMFAAIPAPEAEAPKPPVVAEGKRVLYLDDFTVSTDALPTPPASGGAVIIDRFERPQVQWLAIGDVSVSPVGGAPPEGPGLRAEYQQAPGMFVGLLKMLKPGSLAGMSRLAMTIGTRQSATLVIQVEEAGGGKFNSMLTVRQATARDEVVLDLSSLNPADDSPVKGRAVDPARIARLLILDAYGALEMPVAQPNVLTVRNVRALPAP